MRGPKERDIYGKYGNKDKVSFDGGSARGRKVKEAVTLIESAPKAASHLLLRDLSKIKTDRRRDCEEFHCIVKIIDDVVTNSTLADESAHIIHGRLQNCYLQRGLQTSVCKCFIILSEKQMCPERGTQQTRAEREAQPSTKHFFWGGGGCAQDVEKHNFCIYIYLG